MQVLFLITARGGSKGVPRKNIRCLGGISLVGFKAISAQRSRYCSRLIISTDSREIQDDARRYGVEVPFTRPAELATDTAGSADVIMHAVDWIETHEGRKYDAIMLLEPASPFSRSADFDKAVEMMEATNANLILGVREMEVNSTFVAPMGADNRISALIRKVRGLNVVGRQQMEPEYTANGALYLFKWDFFKEGKSLYRDIENSYGYVMDRHYSVGIDNMIDLHWAEFLVEKGFIDMSWWRGTQLEERVARS